VKNAKCRYVGISFFRLINAKPLEQAQPTPVAERALGALVDRGGMRGASRRAPMARGRPLPGLQQLEVLVPEVHALHLVRFEGAGMPA